MRGLEIKNLTVEVAGKKVVDGLSLSVPAGQVHAIMGPNGTGKSSLSKAIAGHPEYPITGGEVLLDGENIVGLPPDVIARKGFFLAFQYPVEIPGVSIANFIRACLSARLPEADPESCRVLQKSARQDGRAENGQELYYKKRQRRF